MVKRYEPLNDSRWKDIEIFLPVQRKRKLDLRKVMDAILYVARTGIQWRNMPPGFPDWQAVYYYFWTWTKNGTLEYINQELNKKDRKREGREELPSAICVDSQSIKLAPMMDLDRGLDAHKKVNGRKRQVVSDTGGRVWAVEVHAANISDTIGGCMIFDNIEMYIDRLIKAFIDAGYRGTFSEAALGWGIETEVASRPETTKGFVPVKKRWVVERTFGWLNFFRRTTKDYERTTESSASWVLVANITIMLNRLSP